jgi:hypothetical protein
MNDYMYGRLSLHRGSTKRKKKRKSSPVGRKDIRITRRRSLKIRTDKKEGKDKTASLVNEENKSDSRRTNVPRKNGEVGRGSIT